MIGNSATPGADSEDRGAGRNAFAGAAQSAKAAASKRRIRATSAAVVGAMGAAPSGIRSPLARSTKPPLSSSTMPCAAASANTLGAQVTRPGSSSPSTANMKPVSSPTLVKPRNTWVGMEMVSPAPSSTSASSAHSPAWKAQRPECTTNTSAVSWLCWELTQPGGCRAAPMLNPCGTSMCTCWSGFSATPGPMMVKFSLRSLPGVRVSRNAVVQGIKSP